MPSNVPRWGWVKRYTAMAFAVAGVGRIGNEAVHHLGSTIGIPASELALDLTLLLTYVGALLGLLGVYALTTDLSPRLSRVGVLLVGLTAGSILASILAKYIIGGDGPQSLRLIVPLAFYAFSTLSFLVFGVISVRTHVPSRVVGYLLLIVVVSRGATVAGAGEFGAVLFVIPMLWIGYVVRETATRSSEGVSVNEPTA